MYPPVVTCCMSIAILVSHMTMIILGVTGLGISGNVNSSQRTPTGVTAASERLEVPWSLEF